MLETSISQAEFKYYSPFVSVFYNQHFRYYRMLEHKHDEFEIMYIKYGKCRVSCTPPDSDPIMLDIEAGNYIFIRGGIRHNLFVDPDSPCRILNIEMDFKKKPSSVTMSVLENDVDFLKFMKEIPDFCIIQDDGTLLSELSYLHERLGEFSVFGEWNQNGTTAEISLACMILVSRLAHQILSDIQKSAMLSPYVKQAKQFIAENFDNPQGIKIADIAKHVHISPAYLQRMFKKEIGFTIVEYVNLIRIRKAKHLLRYTNIPIVDIAVSVGIESRQHLTNLFTQQEGISPSKYRTQSPKNDFIEK